MPKRVKPMSARALDALRADGFYAVGGVVGLYLCIRGNGRCWTLRIVVGGRRRELGLGSYPEISLAVQARTEYFLCLCDDLHGCAGARLEVR